MVVTSGQHEQQYHAHQIPLSHAKGSAVAASTRVTQPSYMVPRIDAWTPSMSVRQMEPHNAQSHSPAAPPNMASFNRLQDVSHFVDTIESYMPLADYQSYNFSESDVPAPQKPQSISRTATQHIADLPTKTSHMGMEPEILSSSPPGSPAYEESFRDAPTTPPISYVDMLRADVDMSFDLAAGPESAGDSPISDYTPSLPSLFGDEDSEMSDGLEYELNPDAFAGERQYYAND